jgi:hypothetical protein
LPDAESVARHCTEDGRPPGKPIAVPAQAGINRNGAVTVSEVDPTLVFIATGDPEGRGGAGLLVWELGGDPGTFTLVSQKFAGRSVAEIFRPMPESG